MSGLDRADALRFLRTTLTLREKLLLRHPVVAAYKSDAVQWSILLTPYECSCARRIWLLYHRPVGKTRSILRPTSLRNALAAQMATIRLWCAKMPGLPVLQLCLVTRATSVTARSQQIGRKKARIIAQALAQSHRQQSARMRNTCCGASMGCR